MRSNTAFGDVLDEFVKVLFGNIATGTGGTNVMDRSKFGLDLSFPDLTSRVPMTDEEVEEKYEEIRRRSGVLTILGEEYRAELSDITELAELGRGAFGVVRKAQFKKTKTLMAVKVG
ncbi:unnamed protein product [Toxocara canis]|uniref:Protein kinase domain-containing protein n=1 Tax=Toxocara canis TaxID=6265 RepID=A0A183UXQ7_TOXCA|nr:unnamed protein product [Toxocara canis]